MAPSTTSAATAEDPTYMPGLPPKSANTPVVVRPTAKEISTGRLNDANAKLLLSGMHRDGLVVIENIIDPAHLDKINDFMVEDAQKELKRDDLYHNFDVENIQQGPPLFPQEYFFDDVYLNEILFHAVTLYLGPNPNWTMCTGNNALPNAKKRQPVHSDAMGVFPPCPAHVIANVYTVDTSAANGSTEVWLGTHLFNSEAQTSFRPGGATRIRDDFVEERMKTQPGFQVNVKKGSVVLRDMRLWHAGMPNKSEQQRYMIALGYAASWWHGTDRFSIPAKTGTYERMAHGVKEHGIRPSIREVTLKEYDVHRNNHKFDDSEKKSWESEIF